MLVADRPDTAIQPTQLPPTARTSVSVVIPTRNEAANICPLLDRLGPVVDAFGGDVLFVDDSSDDTPNVILEAAASASFPVRLLHRSAADRHGGLGGAVQAGLQTVSGEIVVVMDGDLQHPPEVVAELVTAADDASIDVAVASRYCGSGSAAGLSSALRNAVSNAATLVAKCLFPRALARISDPMSGFFAMHRAALDTGALRPHGFKILLEILARQPQLRVAEVGFSFADRHSGCSKASWREVSAT